MNQDMTLQISKQLDEDLELISRELGHYKIAQCDEEELSVQNLVLGAAFERVAILARLGIVHSGPGSLERAGFSL